MLRVQVLLVGVVVLGTALAPSGCGSPSSPASKPDAAGGTGSAGGSGASTGEASGTREETPAASSKAEESPAGLAELSPADRAAALKQRVCPVSGEALGSMGKPYKVTVKGQTFFLCCDGCQEELNKNPDKYLAKLKGGPAAK
jgi:YHS domain-containing protein